MKSLPFLNATLRRLLLLCSMATTCLSTLTAQDTTTTRMHEVGLQISNFNLENFGLVYKVQRLGQENRYIRYRFIIGNLSFGSLAQGNDSSDYDTYTIQLGSAIGFERRANLGTKIQFIYGPELSPYFSFQKSNNVMNKYQNILGSITLGYILGLQYNINNKFYINLEAVPGLSFFYTADKQYIATQGTKDIINSNFYVNGNFDSNNVALTFAYRFGVARK